MKTTTVLRERLTRGPILVAPGAYDALVARIAAAAGFEAIYMTGAGVAYSLLGQPDIGLPTLTEMAARAASICEAVAVPVIADADTGFGGVHNVYRTVREYERAGVACIQLEDQVLPKRCGHMSGKTLVPVAEMTAKLKAACDARHDPDMLVLARTDGIAVEGLDRALDRAQAYREAGADALFIEAPTTTDMMRRVCGAFPDVPLLANMVEGGATPLHAAAELEAMGYRMVIFPGAAARVVSRAVHGLMTHLRETGDTRDYLDRMFAFGELNTILGLEALRDREAVYSKERS